MLGVVVVAAATSTGQFDAIGVLLALVAAVIYGGAAAFQKQLLKHGDAPTTPLVGCLSGTVACLPFAPELMRAVEAAPVSSVLGVVQLGVFPTAETSTTWGYVLSRTTAGRTAATTYAVPAVVVLLSWLVLRETPPLLALLGGALALAGHGDRLTSGRVQPPAASLSRRPTPQTGRPVARRQHPPSTQVPAWTTDVDPQLHPWLADAIKAYAMHRLGHELG